MRLRDVRARVPGWPCYIKGIRKEIVMPISRKAFALAVLALVLAGGLAVGIWYVSPVRERSGPFTGAEITTLVSGNTVKGPKFSEYYVPDGSIRGREIEDTDEEYLGTWRVEGDRLCVAFSSHDYTSCVSISQDKGREYTFAGSGGPGKRTIIEGNPDKL
jgi:hypothetical protein